MAGERRAMDARDIEQAVERMASEVHKAEGARGGLCLVGIRHGGIPLANRLGTRLEQLFGAGVPRGTLDIGLYRDDTPRVRPVVGPTDIPFSIQDRPVVLVDDVLFTGRTVRAAIDELMDFGRPRRVYLAVLVDRGGRELPISADFVGRTVDCGPGERIEVRFAEVDGEDAVLVLPEKKG